MMEKHEFKHLTAEIIVDTLLFEFLNILCNYVL